MALQSIYIIVYPKIILSIYYFEIIIVNIIIAKNIMVAKTYLQNNIRNDNIKYIENECAS